ncbi:MAG: sensor histidine kinase, partial [Steroidobacteraceae bacterium]
MSGEQAVQSALADLAGHLLERREAILQEWHRAVGADPQFASFSDLSRAVFNDHVPAVLGALEERLRRYGEGGDEDTRLAERASAAEHGLQRWQQGYDQRQAMREWTHLQVCLQREFERFQAGRAGLDARAMPAAYRLLARHCGDGVIESAERYQRLQQTDAASRLRDLEQALVQLQQMERERAEGWRQAAHDLRGSVGIISNTSALLNRNLAEPLRQRFAEVLHRGVASLHTLLTDLIDVARLEAGHEQRNLVAFDAAQVLRNLCDTMRGAAADGNLFLLAQGPESLPVQGDEAKVLRIAQNLLLNAFKATAQGGVRVLWQPTQNDHWTLSVQDTGPGFTRGPAAPLEHALKLATDEAREVETAVSEAADKAALTPAPTLPSQSDHKPPQMLSGEGIGLSIVKRLCELLDASLEVDTAPGAGTTFRVTFPRSYT